MGPGDKISDYLPPSLDELNASYSQVAQQYQGKNKNRIAAIHFLETTHQTIKQPFWQELEIDSAELHEAALGLWIFCSENIPRAPHWWQRYHIFTPEYVKGYLWKSGSTLYSIFKQHLKIDDKTNPLTEKTKLYYLEKFYNLFFCEDEEIQEKLAPWKQEIAKANNSFSVMKAESERIMKEIVDCMPSELVNLLRAIPTDKAIHKKMTTVVDDYAQKKKEQREKSYFKMFVRENTSRKFHAQIVQAISDKLPPDDRGDELTRTQLIHMGAWLYIMESIDHTAWRGVEYSELYKLCKDALNNELKKFPKVKEEECLAAFKNYVNDNAILEDMEFYGKKTFGKTTQLSPIDAKINKLRVDLEEIITQAAIKANSATRWPMMHACGKLGAKIVAAPFFGVGSLIGLTLSESNAMVGTKVKSGNALTTLGTAMLGLSHNYLGLMAASYMCGATLIRLFGKAFEAAGMKVGYIVFGAGGACLDLSYKTLLRFCFYNIYTYENYYDPVLMKDVDVKFFKTLLNLPPNVLMPDYQKQLEKLYDENCEEAEEAELSIKPSLG